MIVPVLTTLVTLGLVYASRGSVGDDARQHDIVLVPLEKVPTTASTPPEFVAGLRETRDAIARMGRRGSLAIRVDRENKNTLTGTVMGVFDDVGNGEYAMVGQEIFRDFAVPRDLVVGILKRGLPLGSERVQLEEGKFA